MLVLSRKEGEKIIIGSAHDGTEIEIPVEKPAVTSVPTVH